MPIFMPPNEYGYMVDISDPRIRPKYEKFKVEKKIPFWCPISDAERLEFEEQIRSRFIKMYPELAKKMLDSLKFNSGENGKK